MPGLALCSLSRSCLQRLLAWVNLDISAVQSRRDTEVCVLPKLLKHYIVQSPFQKRSMAHPHKDKEISRQRDQRLGDFYRNVLGRMDVY